MNAHCRAHNETKKAVSSGSAFLSIFSGLTSAKGACRFCSATYVRGVPDGIPDRGYGIGGVGGDGYVFATLGINGFVGSRFSRLFGGLIIKCPVIVRFAFLEEHGIVFDSRGSVGGFKQVVPRIEGRRTVPVAGLFILDRHMERIPFIGRRLGSADIIANNLKVNDIILASASYRHIFLM